MYTLYWYHLPEHTNPTTEGYIGITKDLNARKSQHKSAAFTKQLPYKFYNALRKYEDLVQVTVLEEGVEEYIVSREIQMRPEDNIGWNTVMGGGLAPKRTGYKHTEETKRKIGKAHKGVSRGTSPFKGMTNRHTEETRKLIGSYHKGKTISEEHKQAISDKLSGINSPKADWVSFCHKDTPEVIHMFVSQKQASEFIGSLYSSVRAQVQRYNNEGMQNYNRKGWKYIP